MFGEFSVR